MTIPNDANTYLQGVIAIPSSFVITDITRSYPMVVTFTINPVTASNTYIPGQQVRLFVPITYGMFQANNLVGSILAVTDLTLSLDINSSNFDVFSVPASSSLQPATLAPFGSRNLSYDNTTGQVPFQSLNNIGN